MHSGLEKKYIQGHLLAFSAAAPIVAITTYFMLHAVRKHTSAILCLSEKEDALSLSDCTHSAGGLVEFELMPLCPQSGNSSQSQLSATGVGMLFSAGTFLYVATVHILPEISSSRTGQSPSDHQQRHLGLLESLTLILGVGLPMVLALGLYDD